MDVAEIRQSLERTAERVRLAQKVISGYSQRYEVMLWKPENEEVRFKVETRYRIHNLNSHGTPLEVKPGMDIEESDAPVFECCTVTPDGVPGDGLDVTLVGPDLLVPSGRVGVIRAKGPEVTLEAQPDQWVDVLWRYSIRGPVQGRDTISFGAVTVGPITIGAQHHNDFEFGLESRNPYLDMAMVNPEWKCETMLTEQHVNFTWRLKVAEQSGTDV